MGSSTSLDSSLWAKIVFQQKKKKRLPHDAKWEANFISQLLVIPNVKPEDFKVPLEFSPLLYALFGLAKKFPDLDKGALSVCVKLKKETVAFA